MAPHATALGTRAYAERHRDGASAEHYRSLQDLAVSSIGFGTYLGSYDTETDAIYREAIALALSRGVNLIDTAINYRCMRSERSIGEALAKLVAEGAVSREEIVICTKGGFIPFDGQPPRDPAAYFRTTYVEPGLARPEEVAAGCHCLAPRYLQAQIDTSLRNLGIEALDVYYLHNPETQLGEVSREEFFRRMRAAFSVLEENVAAGRIRYYGAATWQAFRVPPASPEHLSLAELVELAADVAGADHRFKVVQLPYNLAMAEAYGLANQRAAGRELSALEAAAELGVSVVASVPLYQARLAHNLPADLRATLGLTTDAQRALQFVRSTPGVTSALVGMKRRRHVEENLEVARVPPLVPDRFASLFRSE